MPNTIAVFNASTNIFIQRINAFIHSNNSFQAKHFHKRERFILNTTFLQSNLAITPEESLFPLPEKGNK